MNLLSLPLLVLAAGVIADKTITYSCFHKHGGVDKHGKNETKGGGHISDDFAEEILEHMPKWSNDKYLARQSKRNKHLVVVVCKEHVDTKDEALKAVAEQQKIVNDHKND
jgi:galactose-1-phosphate uridylyltransferase